MELFVLFSNLVSITLESGLLGAEEIKIKPPFIKTTLVDFKYFGQCAQISFQALRLYMIKKGEMTEIDIDSSFIAIIVLKESN